MIQWLRLCASTARGAGSIPGQGTKILHGMGYAPPQKKLVTAATRKEDQRGSWSRPNRPKTMRGYGNGEGMILNDTSEETSARTSDTLGWSRRKALKRTPSEVQ